MPSVVIKRNGKHVKSPWVLTAEEVENLERNSPGECFELINTTTRRKQHIGACKKHKRRKGRR
jgi:hypothetical protein